MSAKDATIRAKNASRSANDATSGPKDANQSHIFEIPAFESVQRWS